MAWNQTVGSTNYYNKKSEYVLKSDYDKIKQKADNCEEQNQRFREKIRELESLINARMNPIERLGYELDWENDTMECYIGNELKDKIYIGKASHKADFRINDDNGSPRGASVEEMKAVIEYLEGGV